MKRREFIAGLGGAAAWPVVARAQQVDRVRRVGMLSGGYSNSDPQGLEPVTAFRQGLAKLGWVEDRNLRIDLRGGLMSCGRDIINVFIKSASIAAGSLNGVNPAELPVLQSTRFAFTIDLKAARLLGIAVPRTLLALRQRADRVGWHCGEPDEKG
jgi:putative ABC transport system substrate-binding protein